MQEPFMTAGENYATAMSDSFGTSITSKSGEIRSAAEGAVNTAFAPAFSATANVNVTAHYNLLNPFNPASIVSTAAAAAGVGTPQGDMSAGHSYPGWQKRDTGSLSSPRTQAAGAGH